MSLTPKARNLRKKKRDGREWSTVEHAYQWKKMMNHGHTYLAQEIIAATTACGAKKISNHVPSYKLTNWGKDQKNICYENNTGGEAESL